MNNYEIADHFSLLSKLMDIHGENSFKAKSYSINAYNIERLPAEVATMDDALVGWILFCKDQQRAIMDIICISPEYQRKGLGKKLIFSFRECWSEVTNLAVLTRKINAFSPLFYESLGFRKTNFMLPEYNPADVQGYELDLL